MRRGWRFVAVVLVAVLLPGPSGAGPVSAKRQLNTMADVGKALRACWRWPPLGEARSGMEMTVRLSFKRNGEVFGARLMYQTPGVSNEERALYHGALIAALKRCSPLPLAESLGAAIAGHPMTFHIHDTRQQRKA
jgi:hypothetical protein